MNKYQESRITTTKLVYIALLVALSFIGSLIKIQGTIALDSMPGFFAALFLDPISGALVASLGHLLTATTSGFPLTIPIHMVITIIMGLVVYIFGVTYKKSNGIIACIIGIVLNGIGSALAIAPITTMVGLPLSGKAFFFTMVGPLTLASVVNIIMAYIIYRTINKTNLIR